jgi:hypothetical protein
MATPPPAKKQNVAKVKAPVVFKQAGLGSPDTCLVVFEQEFHVHSTILKLYSAFFRKFLDSPDKAHATSTKNFKYFWVTEVENDGDWHLVALRANEVSFHKTCAFGQRFLELAECRLILVGACRQSQNQTQYSQRDMRLPEPSPRFLHPTIPNHKLATTGKNDEAR